MYMYLDRHRHKLMQCRYDKRVLQVLDTCTCTHQAKKKNCYVALSRPTVKCEKTGSRFFFFFFLCQIWAKNLLKFVFNGLKKHLHDLYMRFDCIPPEFSPFRNFKKNIGKLNSLTVRKQTKQKKTKKKSRPTDPIFKFWSGEGNITIFFFWPQYMKALQHTCIYIHVHCTLYIPVYIITCMHCTTLRKIHSVSQGMKLLVTLARW